MSCSSIGAMEMHKCAFNMPSLECNNLPWPMAVLDWGCGCQQGAEDPAVRTAS